MKRCVTLNGIGVARGIMMWLIFWSRFSGSLTFTPSEWELMSDVETDFNRVITV